MSEVVNIEVCYALAERQEIVKLKLPLGATVAQAIEASGLLQKYPDIAPDQANKLGIFGKLTRMDAALRDMDRVEIYRPLIADPKEVRRKRAEEGQGHEKRRRRSSRRPDVETYLHSLLMRSRICSVSFLI